MFSARNTWQEFCRYFTALGNQAKVPLRGDNVVIITNGGGAGLLAADHFETGHALNIKEMISHLRP